MKIVAIRGKNLASIGKEFFIAFDTEPLKDSGLYHIYGPTGAGKSTILDALSVALYGEVPRHKSAGRGTTGSDSLSSSDARNLMRRGASEAFAEVEFVGGDNQHYRARWSVQRAHRRVEGTLQGAAHSLINVATGQAITGGKTEVLKAIEMRIGLTYQQFCRSVLLAQNDFSAFLKADDDERSKLLEALTGSEIYTKISAAAFARKRQEEDAIAILKSRVEGVELLSNEELDAHRKEIATLEKDLGEKEKEQNALNEALQWIKTDSDLTKLLADAEKDLERVRKERDDSRPRATTLEQVEKAQPMRTLRDQCGTADLERRKLECEADGLQARQAQMQETKKKADEALRTATKKAADIADSCSKNLSLMENARELDSVTADADKISVLLANINERDLEQSETVVRARTALLNKAETNAGDVQRIGVELAQIDKVVKDASEEMVQFRLEMTERENRRTEAEAGLKIAREKLEAVNLACGQSARELRARLRPNEECPVCGSKEHPHSLGEPYEPDALKQTREEVAAKESAFTTLKDEITRLGARLESASKRVTEKQTERVNHESELKVKSGVIEKALNELQAPADVTPATCGPWLQDEKTRLDSVVERNTKERTELSRLRTEEKTLSDRKLALVKKTGVMEKLQAALVVLSEKSETLKKSTSDLETLEKQLKALGDERKTIFGGESVESVRKRDQQALDAANKATEKAQQALQETENNLAVAQGMIATTEKSLLEKRNMATTLGDALDQRIVQFNAGNGVRLNREGFDELLKRDAAWIENERKVLQVLETQLTTAGAATQERAKRLDEHRTKEHSSSSEQEVRDAFDSLKKEREALGNQKSSLVGRIESHERNVKQVGELETQLKQQVAKAEPWFKLNELIGSQDGKRFRKYAQQLTLEMLIAHANLHLRTLTSRYALRRDDSDTLVLQIIDRHMGNEVRSVYSLSGGETFLVSLALALALASLSSDKVRVESLFIDEGFGSLDAHALEIAMSALDTLQAQGRKVGVISHVEAMRERILTKIEVRPCGDGSSEVVVGG